VAYQKIEYIHTKINIKNIIAEDFSMEIVGIVSVVVFGHSFFLLKSGYKVTEKPSNVN
jgi:hypothetical protein